MSEKFTSQQPDQVDAIVAAWRRERPDTDPSPQGIVGRLHRIAGLLDDALDENFRHFDLSQGEFDVLATLRRAGAPYERTAGELAEHTMITTGGLSKRIDRLEARGLIIRTIDSVDTRRRNIRLSSEGLALVDEAFTAHLALEHRLIQGIADPEAFAATLRAWGNALRAAPQS
ncbi:MarR family transcriptional regulator [Microbacterium mitrae]|uniref:MarR family transcriptional regulator n=1 Tax=Microbacterium mitrae TaxID=664640 RepID=A0A5C8HT43_9MICO|nr:MarR family transcriptional regulator [Microbacterium mitrae]TXK06233.1 MarR family transcriptional regulator [Microbacterium mitrae]